MSDNDALLVAYVDGELEPDSVRDIERLLAEDPRARQAVDIYRETSGLLRAACGEHVYAADPERFVPAPPCVLQRAPRRYGWAVGAALAASIAGFLVGTNWTGWTGSEAASLAAEVAEYHPVYASDQRHLVELPADRLDEITSWLGERLGRKLTIPDLSARGLRFAGARLLAVNGLPVAQLMYTRASGEPIALCLTRLAGAATGIRQLRFGAERAAVWQDGRYAYVVVGDAEAGSIQAIAEDAARQLASG
jgi:anti-sigma factor RsiW